MKSFVIRRSARCLQNKRAFGAKLTADAIPANVRPNERICGEKPEH
jgi:hypothetical protein